MTNQPKGLLGSNQYRQLSSHSFTLAGIKQRYNEFYSIHEETTLDICCCAYVQTGRRSSNPAVTAEIQIPRILVIRDAIFTTPVYQLSEF